MHSTAELRWFLRGPLPADASTWFDALDGPSDDRAPRTDRYLHPTDTALGVKLREDRVEVKRRSAPGRPVALHPLVEGYVEAWVKWSFRRRADDPESAGEQAWVAVPKRRRKRMYVVEGGHVHPHDGTAPPSSGCDLELSAVELEGTPWWTVCFEAHADGASSSGTAAEVLRRVAAHVLAQGAPPTLPADAASSYPAWLFDHLR